MKNLDWKQAEKRLSEIDEKISYVSKMPGVNMMFYAGIFSALKSRYEKGERTQELYDDIMEFD